MPTPKHLAKHIFRWLKDSERYPHNTKPAEAIKIELRRRRKKGLTVHKYNDVYYELILLLARKKKLRNHGYRGPPTGSKSQ